MPKTPPPKVMAAVKAAGGTKYFNDPQYKIPSSTPKLDHGPGTSRPTATRSISEHTKNSYRVNKSGILKD
jgi:hypothetical protein